MNYIKQLTAFFTRAAEDERLNPTHVSLYLAVFQHWNLNHFQNPVSVSRSQLMRISKIGSLATYHKCIKELHQFGYFHYVPSYNPFRGSYVYLPEWREDVINQVYNNETGAEGVNPYTTPLENEQVVDRQQTGTEQALVPSKNSINVLNYTNKGVYEQPTSSQMDTGSKSEGVEKITDHLIEAFEERKEKSCAKKEKKVAEQIPPELEQVEIFFRLEKYPEGEARKFFHYFCSNGWKVGGKAPMRNWQSAAHTWMYNASKLTPYAGPANPHSPKPSPGRLHTVTGKDYSEPL
jgi:hypothetical protein